MIIFRASEILGVADERNYELIAQEIASLVADGELEAVGDISQWRYSEVRLPPA